MAEVSVIIAAYNAESFISETIESVINQTYTDWELIIVDDGSTDRTKEIISNYLVDRRITYVYQENQKQVRARNNAFEKSSGEYIAILDHDDLWEPTKLEKQILFFRRNKDYGLIYTGLQNIDGKGTYLNSFSNCDITENIIPQIFSGNKIAFSSMLIKRKAIRGALIDEKYPHNGDYYLTIRIALDGWKFGFIDEPLLLYRIHNNSLSHNPDAIEKYFQDQIRFHDTELLNCEMLVNTNSTNIFLSYTYLGYASGLIKYKKKGKYNYARELLLRAAYINKNPIFVISCFKGLLKSYLINLKS